MHISFRTKLFLLLLAFAGLLLGAVLGYIWHGLSGMPADVTRRMILGAVANAAPTIDHRNVSMAESDDRDAEAARSRLRERLLDINALPPHFQDARVTIPHERIPAMSGVPDPLKNVLLLVRDDAGNSVVLVSVFPGMDGQLFPTVPDPALERGWTVPAAGTEPLPFGPGGHSMLAYAPVRDTSGQVVAVLAMQACGIHLDLASQQLKHVAIGIFLGALLLAIVPVLLISRRLHMPVERLYRGMKALATGKFDTRVEPMRTGDEFERLMSGFNQMAAGLQERDRMKRALGLAQEIQQRLLPEHAPAVNGFDIAGSSVFCDETGGDYYDFITLSDGRVVMLVGDVSGHGIGAALLMATVRAAVRSAAHEEGVGPAELVAAANAHLVGGTGDSQYATLFCVVLAPPDGTICWAAGGHAPALLCHADGTIEKLSNTGLPVGVLEDAQFSEGGPVALGQGEILLMGTDGIWEQRNGAGEFFGRHRLERVLTDSRELAASDITQAVLRAVGAFAGDAPQADDITVVVCRAE